MMKTGQLFACRCYRSFMVTRTAKYVMYIERVRNYIYQPTTIDKGKGNFDFKYAKGAANNGRLKWRKYTLDNNFDERSSIIGIHTCRARTLYTYLRTYARSYIENGKCTKVSRFSFDRHFSFAINISRKPPYSTPFAISVRCTLPTSNKCRFD